MKFEEWWNEYINRPDCKLARTTWTFNEVGIIKNAMQDAFSHKQETVRCG